MALLSGWKKIAKIQRDSCARELFSLRLPRSPEYYARRTTFISKPDEVDDLLAVVQQRPIVYAGFDSEFTYDRPGINMGRGSYAEDPRSIRPLLISFAFVEMTSPENGVLYPFVVDVRSPEVSSGLKPVFRLSIPFIAHYAKVELFCLWQLGLTEPATMWDSWVCEKALLLGLNHVRSKIPPRADDSDKARAKARGDLDDLFRCSLVRTCHRYHVPFAMETQKERLQKSFISHPEGASFTQEQIRYSAEDALAAARLYPLQVLKATQRGILHHLVQIEMPWTVTNARIEWNGVRIDEEKRQQLFDAASRHTEILQHRLSHEYDIANFRSYRDLVAFFEREGILDLFYDGKKWSFDKKSLKLHRDRHPVIPLLLVTRFVASLPKDKIVDSRLVGADRRVHPIHQQLGAMTGRQTAKWPNVLGISRFLRPLIVPEKGYGIGEVDWSQMEVGIAAAVYHDERLTEMFNSGDVYSAMGQAFYSDRLTPGERTMAGKEFKKQYPKIRAQMKICTLGMVYGITAYGLAQQLNVSHQEAETMLNRFIGLFPKIRQALSEIPYTDPVRGYATTTTGLRRYRSENGQLQGWEKNWMVNHPVQGTAAALMKEAGNRLDRLYQGYHAKLIIPLHDSFIFEAPLPHFRTVAEITRQVMCSVVQEHFPQLRPRADVNIDRPECWNKDGDVGAFTRWMENPEECAG